MLDTKTLLSQQPFLIGMPHEMIDLMAVCATQTHFAVGEYIFHEGEPAESFYLLVKGKVVLEFSGNRTELINLESLELTEALGWSWLFPPYHWKFTARVIEPVDAFVFNARCLRALVKGNHDFGYELMRRIAQLIEDRLLRLLDVYRTNH